MPSGNTRRQVLAGSTLGISTALFGGPIMALAAASDAVDLDAPEHRMTAVMKIYGATDDRVCFGFVQGLFYGLVAQKLTPLYGILAATFNRYVQHSDGTYDGRALEVAYPLDLETGDLLEKFENPYTGEIFDRHSIYPFRTTSYWGRSTCRRTVASPWC